MLLRNSVAAVLALVALAVPAAARADAAPPCRIPPGTPAAADAARGPTHASPAPGSPVAADAARWQSLVFAGPGAAVQRVLGPQFAGAWVHPSDGTWYAGV